MKEEVDYLHCGREGDLIAFLYGELNDVEMRNFRGHMRECAECKAEFASFTSIRESVVNWRNESLAGVSPAATASVVTTAEARRPSATIALREFFNLSPLWLKGAVAFASLLFCLLAALAVARLRDTPPAEVVSTPNNNTHSEQQLNALVDRRVQEELQRIRNAETAAKESVAGDSSNRNLNDRNTNRRAQLAANSAAQNARRPLSKGEREELANDLRLVGGNNEADLDLLDDRMNNSN